MRVVERWGQRGRVELDGVECEVGFDFVPDAAVGEYVIVHAGFALERMDAAEAERTLALIAEAARGGETPCGS